MVESIPTEKTKKKKRTWVTLRAIQKKLAAAVADAARDAARR